MKVHYVIFLLWAIVFAFWLVAQFKRAEKRAKQD